MSVGVLVGLFHHGIFEVVALAQRAVAVVVIIHPLVDRRGLFADGLQRWVRLQQRQRRGQAVVGDSVHPNLAAVVGHIFRQPLDAVVGVGRLIGGLRIAQVHLRRQV